MKLIADTVPTTFTRLDESVVAADRFVDVRTQQQLRTNHNALCGGGQMRVIFSDDLATYWLGTLDAYQSFITEAYAGLDTDPRMMTTIYATDIHVSQLCRKLKFRFKSECSINAQNIQVAAALFGRTEENRTIQTAVINSSTAAWNTMDLTMPVMQRQDGLRQRVTFRLMFSPYTLGAAREVAAAAISASTRTSVTCTSASTSNIVVGDLGHISVPFTSRPIRYIETSGSNSIFHIHNNTPWPYPPPPGTVTFNAYAMTKFRLYAVQLYEYGRSGTFSTLESDI